MSNAPPHEFVPEWLDTIAALRSHPDGPMLFAHSLGFHDTELVGDNLRVKRTRLRKNLRSQVA